MQDSEKIIGIISPYKGSGKSGEREENIELIRKWIKENNHLYKKIIVPHLLLNKILDDDIPEHRELGMKIGRMLYDICDEVLVLTFDKEVSEGMKQDIDYCYYQKGKVVKIF